MLCDIPVHDVSAGSTSVLQSSRNHSGHQEASLAHLNCNLRLKKGVRHALIGRNGCGKTTLLRAVASGSLEGWPVEVTTFLVETGSMANDSKATPVTVVLASDAQAQKLREEAASLERDCESCTGAEDEMEELQAKMERLNEIYEFVDDEDEARARAHRILNGLGFDQSDAEANLDGLSRGLQARCALAAGLFAQPDLLLLDEPTTHLDLQTIEWLQHYLTHNFRGTLLFVSHDRMFVNEVADELIVFEDVHLTYFRGMLTDFEKRSAGQAKNIDRQMAALEKKKEHVRKSIEAIKVAEAIAEGSRYANKADNKYAQFNMGGGASGDKTSRQIAQRLKKLGRMGLEKTADGKRYKAQEVEGPRLGAANNNDGGWVDGQMTAAPLRIGEEPLQPFPFGHAGPLDVREGASVLHMSQVSCTYCGSPSPVFRNVRFNISECCRIGIIGKNGAGKSTLLQLIAGSLPAVGDIWRMPGLEVAFLEQQTVDSMQQSQQSPLEYMQGRFSNMNDRDVYGKLEQFSIDSDMANRAMNSLSTGQCMRIALARIAAEEAHLLVLDEPTSHLDIFSIDALVRSLRNFEGGVIFATHDRYLLDEVADQILIVSDSSVQESQVRLESEVINLDKRQRTWHERVLDPP